MPSSNKLSSSPPPFPPGKDRHHIVVLEGINTHLPSFDFPHTIKIYPRTSPSQIAERIKDASIVIVCILPIKQSDLVYAPHLGILAVMAVGISWVDKAAFATHSVTVTNCPAGNVLAVSEHFLGLYFASRKRIVQVHNTITTTNEWHEKGTLTKLWSDRIPLGVNQETLGVLGYGTLGKGIAQLARAVGFGQVFIAERKGARTTREGRVNFEECLRQSSVLAVCVPKSEETVDLIGEEELKNLRPDALVINVARGGIVNERALVKALREGWITGAATDVLEAEPARPGTGPLTPDLEKEEPVPNLTICKLMFCCYFAPA